MQLRISILIATLILLANACAGFGGINTDKGLIYVSRLWVEPARPAAGTEAFIFVESIDTNIYPSSSMGSGLDPSWITVSAGTISTLNTSQILALHPELGGQRAIIRSWQTPAAAQIVTIKAQRPDGGKSIKVEILPPE